jgi:Tfp pilus assembly protein PilF
VFPRSSGLSRVLLDAEGDVYFGYRLEVARADKRLKVTIKPLNADIANELRDRVRCPDCKPPKLLSISLSRIPGPLMLADGDVVTIELLVNSGTGEKIVDVVKLSTQEFSATTMSAAAERILEALKAALRADYLAARGSYGAAITEYRRALKLNPNDAPVQNKIGICYQHMKLPERAEDQYREALRVNPGFAEAWNNLGSVSHSGGNYRQAVKHYKKAISLRPGFATAYRNMGAAYFALGRVEAGLEAYQAAFRIDPTILEASPGASVTAGGIGRADQYYYFAKICAANGQLEAALAFLEEARVSGFKDWKKIRNDAGFENVVRDPRYQQLEGAGKRTQ